VFPIQVSRPDREAAERAVGSVEKFAILNPGGGWPTKLWSPERFGQLADALWSHYGLTSLINAGPGEETLTESVLKASSSGRARVVTLSLKAFYALTRMSQVYVGGDTGPTHIAVAGNAPVVGLFGPTEWWRNGSPRAADICVERTDIDCRTECHRRSCSKWICMDIEVERVLHAVGRRIETASAQPATRTLPLAG
jgi:lipopolysaccharide heptosyltransferase I